MDMKLNFGVCDHVKNSCSSDNALITARAKENGREVCMDFDAEWSSTKGHMISMGINLQ
jgi:hypothetical protein